MKILIVQTAFIGDVILATPLIEKLSKEFQGATIDFVVRKGNENLLEEHPKLNRLLIWDKKTQKFGNLLKLIRSVRKEQYDILINLQRFGSTGFLTWLSGAKKKAGFGKNPFSFSYDYKVEHELVNGMHEVDRNLQLIEHWTNTETIRPRLYLTEGVKRKTESYKTGAYLVLAPTSVWFTKQFPEEKWIEFLKKLSFIGSIYLIGAPSDFQACDRIIAAANRGKNLCGKLSLMESASLIRDAKMTYVNDSAPMHLASAMNAPTCAIFCSTVPVFGFGPLAEQSHVVQVDRMMECRPCGFHGKKTCPEGHFKCALDIKVDELTQVLES